MESCCPGRWHYRGVWKKKEMGFAPPVSSNLSPVPLSERLVQVINSWLDETPPFSDPSLNLTKPITNTTLWHHVRSMREVTGRPPPWALQGGQGWARPSACGCPSPGLILSSPTGQRISPASACPPLPRDMPYNQGCPGPPPAALLQDIYSITWMQTLSASTEQHNPVPLGTAIPRGQREAEPSVHVPSFG